LDCRDLLVSVDLHVNTPELPRRFQVSQAFGKISVAHLSSKEVSGQWPQVYQAGVLSRTTGRAPGRGFDALVAQHSKPLLRQDRGVLQGDARMACQPDPWI